MSYYYIFFLNQIKRGPEPPLDKGSEKFTTSQVMGCLSAYLGNLSGYLGNCESRKCGERPLVFSPSLMGLWVLTGLLSQLPWSSNVGCRVLPERSLHTEVFSLMV